MRRLLILALATGIGGAALAEDALILPKGVMRARLTAGYSWATQMFDDDAERDDIAFTPPGVPVDKITMLNIGAALEYGIVDGVNVAAQWIPGYNVASTIDTDAIDGAHANGAFDLFVGAKVQLLGDQGLVNASDTMRLALAAGAIVPLPGADFDDEADKRADGDDFILVDPDKHVFGLGGRAYFDYVINERFYVNLYSELIKYFKRDLTRVAGGTENEWNFGYQFTFEVEPHFETALAQGVTLKTGLPLTYVTTPETEVDGDGNDDEGYTLSVRPKASIFLTSTPLPLEFELSFAYPLAGKNQLLASNIIGLQVIAFAKF